MLIGSVSHALDAKGRYIVPAKFRADLGERFVVTEGVGGCLFIFSAKQWEQVSLRLAELPATDKFTLSFKRRFFSRAFELELDAQSRAVLPPLLRDLVAIEKDIVSVGMVNRLEIWSAAKWQELEEQDEEDAAQDGKTADEKAAEILGGLVL